MRPASESDIPSNPNFELCFIFIHTRQFDLAQLSKSTDGLTGAEIEQVFIDAMYRAFAEEEEPSDFTIDEVLVDFVPLSKLMAEQITGLRQWAKGRARPATPQPVDRKVRRIAA